MLACECSAARAQLATAALQLLNLASSDYALDKLAKNLHAAVATRHHSSSGKGLALLSRQQALVNSRPGILWVARAFQFPSAPLPRGEH